MWDFGTNTTTKPAVASSDSPLISHIKMAFPNCTQTTTEVASTEEEWEDQTAAYLSLLAPWLTALMATIVFCVAALLSWLACKRRYVRCGTLELDCSSVSVASEIGGHARASAPLQARRRYSWEAILNPCMAVQRPRPAFQQPRCLPAPPKPPRMNLSRFSISSTNMGPEIVVESRQEDHQYDEVADNVSMRESSV